MTDNAGANEIKPSETYQIDSSNYDSDEEREALSDGEYDRLAEECETNCYELEHELMVAENAFSEEEREAMISDLKERGIISFLRSYLASGRDGQLASLRRLLIGLGIVPPKHLRDPSTPNEQLLPITKIALSRILRRRQKLSQYNSVQDAIELLRRSKRIIVLSGAGISTSCGIPDFRSANGLYAGLQREGRFDLDDPQQMFDIGYFVEHPEVFYSFAKQIYPSNFTPSPCHRWIKLLEDKGVLLRNYTQNIDTLESLAGVQNVLQCHGSFKTASCLRCKRRVPGQTIEPYIMSSQIPYCGTCREERNAEIERIKMTLEARRKQKGKGKQRDWGDDSDSDEDIPEWGGGLPGIIKPDITFFGQALDSAFDECLYRDREEVDLLVIIGTSLKVAPVSEVLTHIPHSVPQIFINLTPVYHVRPDICLLGDADSIVTYLSDQLGWSIPPPAAVSHSPTDATQPGSEHGDELGRPEQPIGGVKLPPDQVVWHTMPGEEHIHLLGTAADNAENVADESGSEDASPIVARLELDDSATAASGLKGVAKAGVATFNGHFGEAEGVDYDDNKNYEEDWDHRPSKRARAGQREDM